MQSNEYDYDYEYYSDSYIEEDDDQPIDVESIYKNITNSLRKIIDKNPLSDDSSLSEAIESRINVLSELCDVISKRYSAIDNSQFQIMLKEVEEAIYGFAQLLENMEDKYENLENSLDTGSSYHVRLFPIPLDEYINKARRELIKDFNEFISTDMWLFIDPRPYEVRKRLPLVGLNKTGRQIKEDIDYYLNNIQLFINSAQKQVNKQLPLLDELKIPEDLI